MRAPRAAGISVLPVLRAAGHRQCWAAPAPAVDGAVAGGSRLAGVYGAVGVTHGRSAAAARAPALGILVYAQASAAPDIRPADVAGAAGRRAAARRPGSDAGGWPGPGAP